MIVADGVFALSRAELTTLLNFTHRGKLMSISSLMLDEECGCAVATDGHRLLVARAGGGCPLDLAAPDGAAGKGTQLFRRDILRDVTAPFRASDTIVIDVRDGSIGKICGTVGPGSTRNGLINARSYVSTDCRTKGEAIIAWPQVLAYSAVPTDDRPTTVALPGEFVAEFAELPRRLGMRRRVRGVPPSITLSTNGPLAPVTMRWVDTARSTTWVAVVMPVQEVA